MAVCTDYCSESIGRSAITLYRDIISELHHAAVEKDSGRDERYLEIMNPLGEQIGRLTQDEAGIQSANRFFGQVLSVSELELLASGVLDGKINSESEEFTKLLKKYPIPELSVR